MKRYRADCKKKRAEGKETKEKALTGILPANIKASSGVALKRFVCYNFIDKVHAHRQKGGRERFLTYLSPIINGVGTYSIEEQTRDSKRMDIVIHYLGK